MTTLPIHNKTCQEPTTRPRITKITPRTGTLTPSIIDDRTEQVFAFITMWRLAHHGRPLGCAH